MYYFEYVAKGKPERRCVEYKDRVILNSSDRMPIQWWSWLHNRRDTVPTPDEIARSELQKEILAEKVAILEAEDEKQRLRQFAGAAHDLSKEEKRARRRKDVILEMRNAASPHSAKNSGVAVSPARERRIDNEELRRNEDEEPSVRRKSRAVSVICSDVLSLLFSMLTYYFVPVCFVCTWQGCGGRVSTRIMEPLEFEEAGEVMNRSHRFEVTETINTHRNCESPLRSSAALVKSYTYPGSLKATPGRCASNAGFWRRSSFAYA